jgi:hypothetical protein
MYLKPTAGCQISTLIFVLGAGPYTYTIKNYQSRAKFIALGDYIKVIAGPLTDLGA